MQVESASCSAEMERENCSIPILLRTSFCNISASHGKNDSTRTLRHSHAAPDVFKHPSRAVGGTEDERVNGSFRQIAQTTAADPYRPAYHFVSPESSMNDPNAIVFWRGRWHLFFIAIAARRVPQSGGYSETLVSDEHWARRQRRPVHWKDLPYAINPGVEKACFSGGMLVEENRVVSFYPGIEAGRWSPCQRTRYC